MLTRILAAAVAAPLILTAAPALAAYNHKDANRDCTQRLEGRYGANHFRNQRVDGDRRRGWRVTGEARGNRSDWAPYQCRVVPGRGVVAVDYVPDRGGARGDRRDYDDRRDRRDYREDRRDRREYREDRRERREDRRAARAADAEDACLRFIRRREGLSDFYRVRSERLDRGVFRVIGGARVRNGPDQMFRCEVVDGRVDDYRISRRRGDRDRDDDDFDDGDLAALGVGVAGLAILGAVLSGGDDAPAGGGYDGYDGDRDNRYGAPQPDENGVIWDAPRR